VRRAYPEYTGRRIAVVVQPNPINVQSYWDSGSRSYSKFIRLDGSSDTVTVPDQSPFDAPVQGADHVQLVPGLACVEHIYFLGKQHVRVHVHPDNAPKFLPAPIELSEDEKIVLAYTRSLKASHSGITNFRFVRANQRKGITLERWNAAKTILIGKGLLNKAGAITNEGRNAIGDERLGGCL
jgi:hypothetical protein